MTSPDLPAFHRRLHRWYAAHGRRDLPWRNTRDAYAIYVSEIMLQQTQVATVLERYYFQFLKRFPSLEKLAAAKQDEVLSAWQGLGYYNRAINLHKAAKQSLSSPSPLRGEGWGGGDTVPALMELPGIGRNTAHAVAAFAHHQPVAVMEANVRRVLSRIFALKNPNEAELWEKAALLLDTKNPFDYNQAMMDIGAIVCKKRAPLCPKCPANIICKGKASPESYPAAKKKKATPVREKSIIVLRNTQGKYFATPRQSRFLNGLYHFVELPHEPRATNHAFLGHVRQQYSHFTLEAEVYLSASGKTGKDWYSFAQLKKLPVSMAEKKIIKMIEAS